MSLKNLQLAFDRRLLRAGEVVIGQLARIADQPRSRRAIMAVVMDLVLCFVAAAVALSLRIGEWAFWGQPLAVVSATGMAFWLPVAIIMRIYSSLIRFSGGRTLFGLGVAVAIFSIPMIIVLMIVSVPGVPRTMGLLHPIFFLLFMALSRLVIRFILVDLLHRAGGGRIGRRRVAIYGAGRAGQQLAVALRHEPQMHLVAFIDDDRRLQSQLLDSVQVFAASKVLQVVEDMRISEIFLALPSASRSRRREIVEKISAAGVTVRALPSVGNIIDGQVQISDLRDVQVEELLGRDAVAPDPDLLAKTIMGQTVLVTGAGGSIGSELCRQIMRQRPKKLVLVDQSELALYLVERELIARTNENATILVAELCDVADAASIKRVVATHRPNSVFHAAAYKHVPLVEANPVAGLRNNVFGTLNTVMAAESAGVDYFILVSTDKAVRPTNVMGASKRICEQILQARAAVGVGPVFSMVRFGNVLGSSGSVVPLFRSQIKAGGPVTLTDRRITRYFMTIPEAAELVIQAGAMASGGEVFVLDMGQSVRIYDLAVTMIHLSGLTVRDGANPDGDIEIREVGLRAGEKLYEELLIGNNPQRTSHERIVQAHEAFVGWEKLSKALDDMSIHLRDGHSDHALKIMRQLVPEYSASQP